MPGRRVRAIRVALDTTPLRQTRAGTARYVSALRAHLDEDVFTPDGPRAEGDFTLAVGTLEPRKNLARIAQAVDGELRVVGARGWGGVAPPANVTWLGNVTDGELARLYRGARCLVYASLYEGFGIPVAEALACGCPVVTSRGSAMAEVAGDDAAYVDPEDADSIREGIARAERPAPRRGISWA